MIWIAITENRDQNITINRPFLFDFLLALNQSKYNQLERLYI